jgi:hypothetical protein
MILDKTRENIRRLEKKLLHPITTKIYSTYPNTEFYPIYPDINYRSPKKPSIVPIQNRRNSVGMPRKLNQYWNPDKQNWVSPNYSRIKKPSRNKIARELLRNKITKVKKNRIAMLFL